MYGTDDNFFELGLRRCYEQLHNGSPGEVAALLRRVGDGLFNVMSTCGLLPVIRAQKGCERAHTRMSEPRSVTACRGKRHTPPEPAGRSGRGPSLRRRPLPLRGPLLSSLRRRPLLLRRRRNFPLRRRRP